MTMVNSGLKGLNLSESSQGRAGVAMSLQSLNIEECIMFKIFLV